MQLNTVAVVNEDVFLLRHGKVRMVVQEPRVYFTTISMISSDGRTLYLDMSLAAATQREVCQFASRR